MRSTLWQGWEPEQLWSATVLLSETVQRAVEAQSRVTQRTTELLGEVHAFRSSLEQGELGAVLPLVAALGRADEALTSLEGQRASLADGLEALCEAVAALPAVAEA